LPAEDTETAKRWQTGKSTKPLLLKEVPRQGQRRRREPEPGPQTEARTTGAQLRVPITPHVATTGGSTRL